jgi:hypothetical protein
MKPWMDVFPLILKVEPPEPWRHDLEMLLPAAKDCLRAHLNTPDQLGAWRNPVEDQNQNRPPKRVIEELFSTKSPGRKAYRDTRDAGAILRKVSDLKNILFNQAGQVQCPVFKEVLDWIGDRTGVTAYS